MSAASPLWSTAFGRRREQGLGIGGLGAANQKSVLRLGDTLALDAGLLEITYDTGARVILQGPVKYDVESSAGGYLSIGKLTARLEQKSEVRDQRSESANQKSETRNQNSPHLCPLTSDLFTVRTPTAAVTDLGTEFGVEVSKDGSTRSHVYRGSVRLQVTSGNGKATGAEEVLHENQSACVESRGDPSGARRIKRLDASTKPAGFVREIRKQAIRTLDLVDVVAGGDGYSGRRNRGIDPKHGQIIRVLSEDRVDALSWDMSESASVTAPNLLRGTAAKASSELTGGPGVEVYHASNAVNGAEAVFNDTTDWVSEYGDANPRLAITGIDGEIRTIRIWGYTDIPIYSVTVRGSTTARQTSLASGDYETPLVPTTKYDGTMSDWTRVAGGALGAIYYKDYAVHAPAGTKSLFFEFGGGKSDKRVRILEVQAFSHPAIANVPAIHAAADPYERVDGLPLIDGVFVPGAFRGPVQTDSAGHTFDGFGPTTGRSPFLVWALGRGLTSGPKTTLGGVNYALPGHGLLFMPANQGITFDLDAVRRANPGCGVVRFHAVGGNAEPGLNNAGPASADLWVLVDGQTRHRRREINSWSGMCPIALSIAPTERFLTLAATDGGNGSFRDWIVFGDPVLELVPDAKSQNLGAEP